MLISAALATLATTGNPVDLQRLLGGQIVDNPPTPRLMLNAGENYAPKALKVNGVYYRMVEPTQTPDNFIIYNDGMIVRLDAGQDERDQILRVVKGVKVDSMMMDDMKMDHKQPSRLRRHRPRNLVASQLHTLATTGDPAELRALLGGEIIENAATPGDMLNRGEVYAPPALYVRGTYYRMVKPTKTPDNFVIYNDGMMVRLDVGQDEGDRVLRVRKGIKADGMMMKDDMMMDDGMMKDDMMHDDMMKDGMMHDDMMKDGMMHDDMMKDDMMKDGMMDDDMMMDDSKEGGFGAWLRSLFGGKK